MDIREYENWVSTVMKWVVEDYQTQLLQASLAQMDYHQRILLKKLRILAAHAHEEEKTLTISKQHEIFSVGCSYILYLLEAEIGGYSSEGKLLSDATTLGLISLDDLSADQKKILSKYLAQEGRS